MQTEPKISVIFPVYNVESYVEKSLLSVMNQTYRNLEVIVVLGASTDRSDEICERIASGDDRVKLLRQTGRGLSDARHLGFEAAEGDYIACLDSDDYLNPDAYQGVAEIIMRHNPDCVMIGWQKIFPNRIVKYQPQIRDGLYSKTDMRKILYQHLFFDNSGKCYLYPPCAWGKIFRSSIIKENLEFASKVLKYNEDLLSSTAFLLATNSLYVMQNEICVNYLYREDSLVNQFKMELFQSDIELSKSLLELSERYPEIKNQVYMLIVHLAKENVFNILNNKNLSKLEKKVQVKNVLNHEIICDAAHNFNAKGSPFVFKVKKWLIKGKKTGLLKMINRMR